MQGSSSQGASSRARKPHTTSTGRAPVFSVVSRIVCNSGNDCKEGLLPSATVQPCHAGQAPDSTTQVLGRFVNLSKARTRTYSLPAINCIVQPDIVTVWCGEWRMLLIRPALVQATRRCQYIKDTFGHGENMLCNVRFYDLVNNPTANCRGSSNGSI